MIRGAALSLLLHGAVLLLLALIWSLVRPGAAPPRQPEAIPIDIVEMGNETASPDAGKAPVPQERAPETTDHPHPQAVPVPKQARPAAAPGKASQKREDSAAQPDPHRVPSPANQDGAGVSNAAAGADGARGNAAYGVKDYVRAQIERRWYPPGSALLRNDWVVQLHLQLNQDGSVGHADIIDNPRMGDTDYRDFAFSLRNAAVLSAPFALPAGLDDAARDMTLDFNPRRVQQ